MSASSRPAPPSAPSQRQRGARVLALSVFGAVVLSAFDAFHTHGGTTRYAHPIAFGAAWWTPLIFGCTTGLGGLVYSALYARLGGRRAALVGVARRRSLAVFGGVYYASASALPNAAKLALLALIAGALWAWLDRSRAGALLMALLAIAGPCAEIVQVTLGLFAHLQPDLAGVPMWLPALYAASGPVLGQGARKWLSLEPVPVSP